MGSIKKISAIIQLIKEVADPIAWANSFRQSWRKYKEESERKELAKQCRKLSSALYRLEVNPSGFLYGTVDDKALFELTDEQLRDPENLEKITSAVALFNEDYDQVLKAFSAVENRAYEKLGDVIVELSKGLKQRRHLLDELASVENDSREPEEIRALGLAYEPLIDGIEPLREAIRLLVAETTHEGR